MAGHSKWANIKHRKAAQDAKRGKLFTKLIRELVVAARAGGPVAEDNPRLRAAVDKALSANMKRDTIDNAIARGAGTNDADNMEELTYYGRKRIHNLKYYTWVEQQGKTYEEIQQQWYDDDYWESIPACVDQIDALIEEFNAKTGLLDKL